MTVTIISFEKVNKQNEWPKKVTWRIGNDSEWSTIIPSASTVYEMLIMALETNQSLEEQDNVNQNA